MVDVPDKVDLKGLFEDLQREMKQQLQTIRRHVSHPGKKGDGTEEAWRKTLGNYLPRRYQVAEAAVVDANGQTSEQVDVLIFDAQYSPFILNQNNIRYVPAESVYAALEVKQEFTKDHIAYAGGKVASVRRLHRSVAPAQTIDGPRPAQPQFRILGGVLASKSSWAPPFGKAFEEALASLEKGHELDLGCALEDGTFEVASSGGLPVVNAWQDDTGLVRFLLVLLRRLQQLGNARPIAFEVYESSLD